MGTTVRFGRTFVAALAILLAGTASAVAHPGHEGPLVHFHWFEVLGVAVGLAAMIGAARLAKRYFGRGSHH